MTAADLPLSPLINDVATFYKTVNKYSKKYNLSPDRHDLLVDLAREGVTTIPQRRWYAFIEYTASILELGHYNAIVSAMEVLKQLNLEREDTYKNKDKWRNYINKDVLMNYIIETDEQKRQNTLRTNPNKITSAGTGIIEAYLAQFSTFGFELFVDKHKETLLNPKSDNHLALCKEMIASRIELATSIKNMSEQYTFENIEIATHLGYVTNAERSKKESEIFKSIKATLDIFKSENTEKEDK